MSPGRNESAPSLAAKGARDKAWDSEDSRHFSTTASRIQSVRLWLARVLTGRDFFNPDASLEIDRLLIENERLRAQIAGGRA